MERHDSQRQRRFQRVDTALKVRISTIDPERDPWTGRPFFRATRETCENVSRGGVYVRTEEPLAPGRRVLLELVLPDGAPVEAIGRVAWQRRVISPQGNGRESGVGVEFLGAASEQFSALEDFIHSTTDVPNASEGEV